MRSAPDEAIDGRAAGRVAELELLLSEAYHRIANGLQLATAALGGELAVVEDPVAKARLRATRGRIEAIARVHALLATRPSAATVPLHEYLAGLIAGLQRSVASFDRGCTVSLACDRLDVPPDVATRLGMITSELFGNACKYAYPEDGKGEVRVSFVADGNAFVLEVEDDGCGVDLSCKPNGSGLGAPMIRALARLLGGELNYESRPVGTLAVLRGRYPIADAERARSDAGRWAGATC